MSSDTQDQIDRAGTILGARRVLRPDGVNALQEALAQLAKPDDRGEAPPIAVLGRGTRIADGIPFGPIDTVVTTAAMNRITRFAPDDLTCGVEPGVTLAQLSATIEQHDLTFEPGPFPQANERSIGGLLGEAPTSPRGFDRGALRSQVIGIHGVGASGAAFHAGGNVVKNVAGYDLCKLFVGSGGAFFVAAELQLRLTPMPEACAWLESKPRPWSEAYALWRQTRDRLVDARAVDLVFAPGGGAHVEVLLAGPPALVASLERQPDFGVVASGRESWHRAPPPPPTALALVRGRILPTSVGQLGATLDQDTHARFHLQGAFWLATEDMERVDFPPDAIVRPVRGVAPSTSGHSRVARRLKDVFGANLCPTRTAFDAS